MELLFYNFFSVCICSAGDETAQAYGEQGIAAIALHS